MRLIDADALREDWLENGQNEYVYDTNAFLQSIDEQSTIEAEPVRHGDWIEPDGEEGTLAGTCSVCRWECRLYEDDVVGMPFCPNCGAKMDGKETDDR